MPGVYEDRGGTVTNYHSGIKNSFMQTSAAGSQTASKRYDAFGNVLASSGTWQGRFAYGGPHGYQTDGSLQLLGDRYYDPSLGRFLTRDVAKDGRNWYAYCGNNPIAKADPSGFGLSINSPAGVRILMEMLLEDWQGVLDLVDPALLRYLLGLFGLGLVITLLNLGLIPIARFHDPGGQMGQYWGPASMRFDVNARSHYDIPDSNGCRMVTTAYLSIFDFILGRATLRPARMMSGDPLNNGYFEIFVGNPHTTIKNPLCMPMPPGFLAPKHWSDNGHALVSGRQFQ
jgi:RHS repeat-associated protein